MKNSFFMFLAAAMMTACEQTVQTYDQLYENYDVEYVSDCLFHEDLVCEFE